MANPEKIICSICWQIKPDMITDCGHRFHQACLDQWLFGVKPRVDPRSGEIAIKKTSCPMCRTPVIEAEPEPEEKIPELDLNRPMPTEADIEMVMNCTDCTRAVAIEALQVYGDVALAIMEITEN